MPSSDHNLVAPIVAHLTTDGDRIFLSGPQGNLTATGFVRMVAARQTAMRESGVAAGKRVFVPSGRGALFWIDIVALWGIGAVVIPLPPALETAAVMDLAGRFSVWGICADAPDDPAADMLADDLVCLGAGSMEPDDTGAPADVAIEPVEAQGVASILLTSGSTGAQKGVLLSHEALRGNCDATCEVIDYAGSDRHLFAVQFHFTSAINHFLAVAIHGRTLVAQDAKLLPRQFIDLVSEFRPSSVGGAPLQLRWLADSPTLDANDAPRWIMSSGDRMNPDIGAKVRAKWPDTTIYVVYGLTEVGGRLCILPPASYDAAPEAVGIPIRGMKVRIRDEDLQELGAGNTGEIWVSGTYLFYGYDGDPEITRKSLIDNEFRTGDLGYVGDDGLLRLVGRSDDVFKTNGQKVSLQPIADAIHKTGLCVDAAVVARSHPVMGHTAHACIVPKDPAAFKKGDLLRHLRKSLSPEYIPTGVTVIQAVPRTGSGKVDRRALVELIDA